jgi:SAM-dependent methyltransferase
LALRTALLAVPGRDRDAWVDRVLGIDAIPDDSPELPHGCVPYLPSSVDVLLRIVDRASIRSSDVFVDVGSGVGRAAALVHLLTGAAAIGIEIQPELVRATRELTARLQLSRVAFFEGDAAKLAEVMTIGTVFLLYCPFSGERLTKVLESFEKIASMRTIRVCFVDLPAPSCSWLTLETAPGEDLAIYRSTVDSTSRGSSAAHEGRRARS